MSREPAPLLPCPFCGNTPEILTSRFKHILIHKCVIETTGGWFSSKKSLIEKWNTRVEITPELLATKPTTNPTGE